MASARLQKKLIILRCKYNKLIKILHEEDGYGKHTNDALLGDFLGQNAVSNIRRWIDHPEQGIIFEYKYWSKIICSKLKIDVRTDLFDDNVRSWEFGALLGLSRTTCKYLTDMNYNEKHELIQSIVYNEDMASRVAYDLAGIYELILDVPGAKKVYGCPLQIRYYLPVDSKDIKKGFRIRCKLLINRDYESSIINGIKIFEYDGYIVNQPNHLYFVFESRSYYGGRRMLTLSFGSDVKDIDDKEYKIGEYLRSEPLNGSSRRGGAAFMRCLARDRRAIMPSSDLSTIEDDQSYEAKMGNISFSKPYMEFDPEH